MSTPVRVVVADDHPMFRYGLCAALAGSPELDVVGEAVDGADLQAMVNALRPDVVLTDLAMPGGDGQTATQMITEQFPDIAVLVLTMNSEDEAIVGSLRAGARGYLLKGAERDEIVRAVLTVASGGTVYDREIGHRIATYFAAGPRSGPRKVFDELTERENEVLEHVASGRNNHEIAGLLFLSEKTVRNHVSSILTKLQVRDRAAAVAKARDMRMGQGERSKCDGTGTAADSRTRARRC